MEEMEERILKKHELVRLYIDNIYVGCIQVYKQKQLKIRISRERERKLFCIQHRGANLIYANKIEILYFLTKEYEIIDYATDPIELL